MNHSVLSVEFRRGCCPYEHATEAMVYTSLTDNLDDMARLRTPYDMVITGASATYSTPAEWGESWETTDLHIHVKAGERITIEEDIAGPRLVVSKVFPMK